MLNELYQLSDVLESRGINPYEWHKNLRYLPNSSDKKPCYCILIDKDINILGIEPMKHELTAVLRKWETSNGISFPGLNINPLYRVTDKASKDILKKWQDGKEPVDLSLVNEWCAGEQSKNWDKTFDKKMEKCLGIMPSKLQKICGDSSEDFISINRLCERVTELANSPDKNIFEGIKSYIYTSIEKGGGVRFLLSLLIHEGSSNKKPEKDRGSISVFMDVPDWEEYPVAHEKAIKYINNCLLYSTLSSNVENTSVDAFGNSNSGASEKLPEVKLPILGSVKLRAMNSESPCQYRYGTIDASSFDIGNESRKKAKSALEWLAPLHSNERKGKTWGRADEKELIFAYPKILPDEPPKLTACLGADSGDDTEARFENYAKDVINCLMGIGTPLAEIELHVFSLRKMDKARTKVVFNRNYSAQRLADAAEEWQEGCANIPSISFRAWGEKKGEIIMDGPKIPFPLQISDCLNRIWKLDGTTIDEVKLLDRSLGIELLLDEELSKRKTPHLLLVALQNTKGLFLSLGNTLHSNDVLKLDGFNKQKQLVPAILGLLLLKLGIRKESYMNNSPYLVGRMLKLADELHALYCKEVRKDKLPPQLLGNALMVAALDSPTQALAQLAMRIPPYLGWARTNSGDESAGLSRYFLKEFGIVESKLRDLTLPLRLDDASKAQLLLGYVSDNSKAN